MHVSVLKRDLNIHAQHILIPKVSDTSKLAVIYLPRYQVSVYRTIGPLVLIKISVGQPTGSKKLNNSMEVLVKL